jgi:hypothetical protein
MLRYIALLLALVLSVGVCGLTGGFAGLDWLWLLPVSFIGSLLALLVLFAVTVIVVSTGVNTKKEQTDWLGSVCSPKTC